MWRGYALRPIGAFVALLYLFLLLALLPLLYLGAAAVGGVRAVWNLWRGPKRD